MSRTIACLAAIIALAVGPVIGEQDPPPPIGASAGRGQLSAMLALAVEGRFIERFPGSYVFAPSDPMLPVLPVANPERLTTLAVGPTVRTRGSVTERGQILVASFSLKPLPRLAMDPAFREASDLAFAGLSSVVSDSTLGVESRTLMPGLAFADQIRKSMADVVSAYGSASRRTPGAAAIRDLVETWAQLRESFAAAFPQSPDTKAMYGELDNYSPWTYDRIFRQSGAVVAVGEPGRSTARCSGVLIASDLVLTAAHCFSGPPAMVPSSLEVWFDFTERSDLTVSAPRRVAIQELVVPGPAELPRLLEGRFTDTFPDYAVVRLAESEAPTSAALAVRPCLRRSPLNRGDAIYVVGYPRGEAAKVHDSARVYLPYRVHVNGGEFDRLRLDVLADLRNDPASLALMQQFDLSYQLETIDGVPMRGLKHIRDNGQPRMGIVADTFHGNSGGPVYDRNRGQCIVGIFVAGEDDTGQRRRVSWTQHERVLPMTAILKDLEGRNATRVLSVIDVR